MLTGAFVFMIAGFAMAPASFYAPVLKMSGIDVQYQALTGSVWRGQMKGVVAAGQPVGDLTYNLHALSLFSANPQLDIELAGPSASGKGRVGFNLLQQAVAFRNVTAEFDLSSVKQYSLFGIPYDGAVRSKVNDLIWSRQGCGNANGDVWTDVLDASSRQYLGDGLVLSGPASCAGDNLKIDLAGANAEGETTISILVSPALTYQLSASVEPHKPQLKQDLKLLGFEDKDGALVYDAFGALKGAGI
ncbi:MAG: type II secretion system protein N [Pseudomonadota bacterium]